MRGVRVIDTFAGYAAGAVMFYMLAINIPNGKPVTVHPGSQHRATNVQCPQEGQEGRFVSDGVYRILPEYCYWECREQELMGSPEETTITFHHDYCEFK